jgi:hypothetical protein
LDWEDRKGKRGRKKKGKRKKGAHQLVAANHSHDRQRLDAVLLRVKRLPAALGALVSKHHVRVHVGVEVLDALLVALNDPLERRDGLRILAAPAPPVVAAAVLLAVAVDVHVGKVAARALDVDDVVVFQVVAAVREGWWKGVRGWRVRNE